MKAGGVTITHAHQNGWHQGLLSVYQQSQSCQKNKEKMRFVPSESLMDRKTWYSVFLRWEIKDLLSALWRKVLGSRELLWRSSWENYKSEVCELALSYWGQSSTRGGAWSVAACLLLCFSCACEIPHIKGLWRSSVFVGRVYLLCKQYDFSLLRGGTSFWFTVFLMLSIVTVLLSCL